MHLVLSLNVPRSWFTTVDALHSPFGAYSAVRSAGHEEKMNENPNASFFGSGTCAWRAARGSPVVRCSRHPGRQSHGKGRLKAGFVKSYEVLRKSFAKARKEL